MFIAVTVLTMIVFAFDPKLHKPFVLEKQDFKMAQYTQEPASLQTLRLFRMGESPVEEQKIVAKLPEDAGIIKSQVHLEPSEFYKMASGKKKTKVKELEVIHIAEKVSFLEEREDPPLMFIDQPFIWLFIPVCPPVFHSIFLVIAFNLSVSDHRKAR